jgi:prepilin-type N-terminal cleavage/methylation domain-containing protein
MPGLGNPTRKGQAGFSMLELMVALAVAGMIGAAAIASFKKFGPRSRIRHEASLLVDNLWELRSQAATGQVRPCIDFPSTGGYRLFRDRDEPRNGFPAGDTDDLIRQVTLKPGLKFQLIEGGASPNQYVCFESRGIIGSANGPLRVRIGLVSGTESKVVELLPSTGIAKVL